MKNTDLYLNKLRQSKSFQMDNVCTGTCSIKLPVDPLLLDLTVQDLCSKMEHICTNTLDVILG